MAASQTAIEEFLSGPLVTWLATCVKKPDTLQVYETFFDGAPFTDVLLQIDPEPLQPVPSLSNFQGVNITFARIKIFSTLIRNIKNIYEEELGQIIISLPDCVILGRSPSSETALEQFKLLLLLLLGCAVQGPTKEHFILKIKQLSVDTQHDIVECIKRVTDDQNIVLTLDQSDQKLLYDHIRSLSVERDKLLSSWMTDLGQEANVSTPTEVVESNHLAVELADWKARLRKQRQELEEKTEILAECREELEHANAIVTKLKAENSDLLVESRRAKIYRDEIDAMRERVERADRLESETQRYREKLADAEFYKIRVDELREDNRVLLETREMLENQLSRARQRADHVLELEAELLASKQNLNEIILERDSAKEKIQQLIDENLQLQQVAKQVLAESKNRDIDVDLEESTNSGDNSLSEQLTNNAEARALRLELENKKLSMVIDNLKERSLLEDGNRILELEKEKKILSLKCQQLEETLERVKNQNDELESLFKNAIQENRKLQDNIDNSGRQMEEQKFKMEELERSCDSLNKEKERIQILCDTIKKRADNTEKSFGQLQIEYDCSVKDKEKITQLEKENQGLQKDVAKLKELLETKDLLLDRELEKFDKKERDYEKLSKEVDNLKLQTDRLQDCENRLQELALQKSVFEETITSLEKDLINEKLNNEKCKSNLEKLSLTLDILDCDVGIIVENMLKDSNIRNLLEKKTDKEDGEGKSDDNQTSSTNVLLLENQNQQLQAENAKLQVELVSLKSQLHSLQTQQTALQLANSQLVAEKDELSKQQQLQNEQLLVDQVTLRTLHEQLSTEYEQLLTEQDNLKKINRDLRSEVRQLKETISGQKTQIFDLELERDSLKNGAKNLAILRAEHSKLKDDFRNLFTASERLKIEYRSLQDELKKLRNESRNLRLGQTEMQGELNSTSDLVAGLHLENGRLQQKCDMLFEMNHSLDADRRALMDHVSQLLTQYHSLLTHSLEDKQHYHLEEKLYTDKVNNLCRQKEKLEEKIMEHYRKLDNASSCKQKKGFGATLVRKVRKAGSDIINKVPTSRNRRSWHEGVSSLNQSQFTLAAGSDSDTNSLDENTQHQPNNNKVTSTEPPPFKRAVPKSSKDDVIRRSHRNSSVGEPDTSLSLGSVGSRRTVYLSEDEPTNNGGGDGQGQTQPPLLVYNRISTVLGEVARPTGGAVAPQESAKKEGGENSKETAVWYEYGCV